jgi:hypothetical protein
LISHADRSKNPDKRWMAVAVLHTNHRWLVCELSKISESSSLFVQLNSHQPKLGCILSGFDFPIGVPSNYAAKAGISDLFNHFAFIWARGMGSFIHPC